MPDTQGIQNTQDTQNTKERILMTALACFARDGYEAVSISDIAGALGMSKGALYRHYRNKRDLFDSMIRRMLELDSSAAAEHGVPQQRLDTDAAGYDRVSWAAVKSFTLAQFRFWTEDAFACPFRRMLSLEQYRSEEMGRLYRDMLVTGPVDYMADILRSMMDRGLMQPGDADALAAEYYAPMFLLIAMADGCEKHADCRARLEASIDVFIGRYRLCR